VYRQGFLTRYCLSAQNLVTREGEDGSYEEAGESHRQATREAGVARDADWGLDETVHLL